MVSGGGFHSAMFNTTLVLVHGSNRSVASVVWSGHSSGGVCVAVSISTSDRSAIHSFVVSRRTVLVGLHRIRSKASASVVECELAVVGEHH